MSRTSHAVPYLFTIAVEGVDLSDEAVVEALVSRDVEVYPAVLAGTSTLTYRITAESSYDAVVEAITHFHSVSPAGAVSRIELDLVSISDIASRLGRARESVRAWVVGSRGPKDFPSPMTVIGDGIRVWDWPSVNQWLKRTGVEGHDEERLLSREEIDELNVLLVRRRSGAAQKSFRLDRPVTRSTVLTVGRAGDEQPTGTPRSSSSPAGARVA